MDPVTNAAAEELLQLWLGPPQDRAQVMPRLAELNRFTVALIVCRMVSRLQDEPAGSNTIPRLLEAVEEAAWRYA